MEWLAMILRTQILGQQLLHPKITEVNKLLSKLCKLSIYGKMRISDLRISDIVIKLASTLKSFLFYLMLSVFYITQCYRSDPASNNIRECNEYQEP